MANLAVSVCSIIAVAITGGVFSVSVLGHGRNILETLVYVFVESYSLGVICVLVYAISWVWLLVVNTQRLRDMGYGTPMLISILLAFLGFISSVFSYLGGVNFISLAIDLGLAVFFLIMLFSVSKESEQSHK